MIAIVDYGVGNLFSLKSSLGVIGAEVEVTGDAEVLRNSEKIILPGVGAFEDAIEKLRKTGLDKVILEEAANGKPLLGICLGMQMLFEKSYEYGEHLGLGLIEGSVKSITPVVGDALKVPHIGWNGLIFSKEKSVLYRYVEEDECVYFVHSFAAMDCDSAVTATTEYGAMLTASVEKGNVYGTQFHPEKSGEVGLKILRAFCEL
ncbi:imidazole glycerol phosphate synthase subunit HisH [Anaerotignum propionicum]|uniref:imidazole glycerol phosphate synthase subunit HisH n=1 Tax=Anaerotignum propionicum TaxID=28446 RepID=UPI00210D9351|nr:imidazole glycerol phosphate synthase subunit HisH [Anaerotignum propionicum]MCQ4934885.1 imidazole glycerol phosphate synthase subunit HisH [Anaerotignum propionicum]